MAQKPPDMCLRPFFVASPAAEKKQPPFNVALGLQTSSAVMVRLLTLFSLFLVACGPKSSHPGHYRDGKFHYTNPAETEAALKDWRVDCEDQANCPGYVGQLTIRRLNSQLEVCTGFLIDNETVMTNSHCMPEPDYCSQNVKIHFPATSTLKAETFECDRVILKTQLGKNPLLKDFSSFKLKTKVSRGAVKLDKETGVKNDENLQIVKVDPEQKSAIKGVLRVRKMKVVYESFQTPSSNNPYSSIHALVGGQIVPGNSGSPIVTPDFSSVKLITQSIVDKNLSWFPDVFEVLLKSGPPMAFATNITCVDLPSDKCDDVADRSGQQFVENKNALLNMTAEDQIEIRKLVDAKTGNQKILGPRIIREKIQPRQKETWIEILQFKIVPECFMNPKAWLNEFKKGGSFVPVVDINWPLLVFKKQIGIDDKGHTNSRIVPEPGTPAIVRYSFSPAELNTKSEAAVQNNGKTEAFRVCQ